MCLSGPRVPLAALYQPVVDRPSSVLWGSEGYIHLAPLVWQGAALQDSPCFRAPGILAGSDQEALNIMVDMGQGATGTFENNSQEPTLGCGTSSLAPSPERLSVESRKPGEERAGCVWQGKGLTSVFLRKGGREHSWVGRG